MGRLRYGNDEYCGFFPVLPPEPAAPGRPGVTAGAPGAAALRRENEALRARFAALGEASLRIGASR